MTLDKLNALSVAGASDWFSHICAARSWISCMVESRPYSSKETLLESAIKHWRALEKSDYREAMAAEPVLKIGSLNETVDADKRLAFNSLNINYLKQHGFIFITTVDNCTAQDLVNELTHRLSRSTDEELATACDHYSHLIEQRINNNLD